MKRISVLPALILLCAGLAQGQAASPQEAEENYKSLKGHVQDLLESQSALDQRIQSLGKEIAELRDQAAKPTGNYATQDDLKRLADAIQEIDKKREADKELILKEIEKLGQAISAPPATPTHTTHVKTPPQTPDNPTPTQPKDETGVYYKIKAGDKLSVIAQNYREQGLKVSVKQIVDANPGLDPDKLIVGKQIFVPATKIAAK